LIEREDQRYAGSSLRQIHKLLFISEAIPAIYGAKARSVYPGIEEWRPEV